MILSLRARLFFSYLAVIVVTVLVSALGLSLHQRADQKSEKAAKYDDFSNEARHAGELLSRMEQLLKIRSVGGREEGPALFSVLEDIVLESLNHMKMSAPEHDLVPRVGAIEVEFKEAASDYRELWTTSANGSGPPRADFEDLARIAKQMALLRGMCDRLALQGETAIGELDVWEAGKTARLPIVLAVLTLCSVLGVGYVLAGVYRRIYRPILQLKKGTERVRAGDFSRKTGIVSTDEIGELAGSFDAMTEGLQDARKNLTELNRSLESERAKLREALDRREEERLDLLALFEISKAVSSTLDPSRVMKILVAKVAEVIDVVRCSLIALDPEGASARVVASSDNPAIENLPVHLDEYPEVAKAIEEKEMVLVNNVATDPLMAEFRDKLESISLNAVLAAPVIFENELYGVLLLRKFRPKKEFTGREVDLCGIIANSAASAFKNAYLFESVEKGRAQLAALNTELQRSLKELRAAEEKVIESERMAAVGEISQAIAHNIRNPLAGIRASAQVAMASLGRESEFRENMEDIITETDRLDKKLMELLRYSRPQEFSFTTVRITAVLEALLLDLQERFLEKKIREERSFPPGDWAIEADEPQIRQVFEIVLNNALEATHAGGKISVGLSAADGAVNVVIRDTGSGVQPADMEKLFKPYFTTKTHGTGLGMSIARNIIQRHGGRIHVRSEPGKGTEVEIQLPCSSRKEQ